MSVLGYWQPKKPEEDSSGEDSSGEDSSDEDSSAKMEHIQRCLQ